MPQIICTLPNASASISGVKFTKHEGGVISEEITDAQAEVFLSIPGYELVPDADGDEPAPEVKAAPKPHAKAPKKAEPVDVAPAAAAPADDSNVF